MLVCVSLVLMRQHLW